MNKRKGIANAVLAACMSLFAAYGLAQVVQERDDPRNDSADSAEHLTMRPGGPDGKGIAIVRGVIGNLEGPVVPDVDFYSFRGRAGDLVTVNIDDGIGGVRSVNTIVALFRPDRTLLVQNTDNVADQPGPGRFKDARIGHPNPPARLPVDGIYFVGVSGHPRSFLSRCCNVQPFPLDPVEGNGDYTLIITGVTVPYIVINLEIKPGSGEYAPFNPKARGVLPVALMGSSQFDATAVRRNSLKFGRTGEESSYLRCAKEGEDIDGDGHLDLVCHFDNQLTRFVKGDTAGILTGLAGDGTQIRGQGDLKVIPE